MLGDSRVSVHIDEQALTDLVNGVFDDNVRQDIVEIVYDSIDPWTPFLTGKLANTVDIQPDYIEYEVPYAEEKYYGDEPFHKEFHPLASNYWDEVALSSGAQEEIDAKATEYLKSLK